MSARVTLLWRRLRDRMSHGHGALVRDTAMIVAGAFVFALGLDCFQAPNGIAAGGASGLAIVIRAWVLAAGGPELPVGIQTLVMNALLMVIVVRSGGLRYLAKTIVGIVAMSVWTDALAPVVPVLGDGDLLLAGLWGGVVTGVGLGLVFRAGGNTGGTDILAQLLNRKTGIPVGTSDVLIGLVIVALSATMFSVETALYAAISMFICGRVCDMTVDGPRSERMAWIISERHEEVARRVLHELDRGCTEVEATGKWTGERRPMLMVILRRGDVAGLKSLVAECDPDAIVVITEAHEAFGEGFRKLSGE